MISKQFVQRLVFSGVFQYVLAVGGVQFGNLVCY